MEQETLYTAAKWEVLKALSGNSKSPIELAEAASTSISNISQSLRFLEVAGIVTSERVSNRDKGQPRVMYSLAGDRAYLIVASENFVEKKQIFLSDYKKMILRIWFYDDDSLHPFLEDIIREIYKDKENLKGIFLEIASSQEIRISLVLDENSSRKEFKDMNAKGNGDTKKVKFKVVDVESIRKASSKYYPIYDPQQILEDEK